jgi:hypothetical protein
MWASANAWHGWSGRLKREESRERTNSTREAPFVGHSSTPPRIDRLDGVSVLDFILEFEISNQG